MRRFRIPSSSALIAFESAARHCSFRKAAEELHTSQPAVSRHIKGLEESLGTALFERRGRDLVLSLQGRRFQCAVISALEIIHSTSREISCNASSSQLLIACSHEISHLYLMPRIDEIQDAIGSENEIRVLTVEYELQDSLATDVDVCFVYRLKTATGPHLYRLLGEKICPICAPSFFDAHRAVLSQPAIAWRDIPLLELNRPNYGWATWADWLLRNGVDTIEAFNYQCLDNYVYILEAAAAGKGLALGWAGLMERYTDSGMLIAFERTMTQTDGGLFAIVSPQSDTKPAVNALIGLLTGQGTGAAASSGN